MVTPLPTDSIPPGGANPNGHRQPTMPLSGGRAEQKNAHLTRGTPECPRYTLSAPRNASGMPPKHPGITRETSTLRVFFIIFRTDF